MAQTATASELGRRVNLLDRNIRLAREAHAEKLEAIRNIHDAAVLRLEVLKEELTPLFSGNPAARRFVDLALVPGHPPRLWIDMTSYVIMSPDPSTYLLQRDSFSSSEVLFQSSQRDEVVAAILRHVASHLVEREKQLQLMSAAESGWVIPASRSSSLMLAWLSGLTLGISMMAAVLSWAIR